MSKRPKRQRGQRLVTRHTDVWGLSGKRKGAFVEYEIDVDAETGKVDSFRIVYINPMVYSRDNGRVLGYDNSHGYWHRHCLGGITKIEEMNYEEIIDRFKQDLNDVLAQEDRGEI